MLEFAKNLRTTTPEGWARWCACSLLMGVVTFLPGASQGQQANSATWWTAPQSGANTTAAAPPSRLPGQTFRPDVVSAGGFSPEFQHPPAYVTPASGMIQPVQNSAEMARTLHRLVESMPTTHEDLEIIERRSQLMNTRANVTRIHIVDSSIVEVVQYGPRELAFMGMARGSTSLMVWFEGERDPIIYLVKVVRDPSFDVQRRIDYGKLEKRINTLFPNSKVYLIPLTWKVVVRGQARDQQEAAHILQIIQTEVLAQDGSLFGNNGFMGYGGGAGGFGGVGDPGAGGNGFNNGFGNQGFWQNMIVNELQIPGEFQIALRVRIAELNRSQARSLGVDLNVLFNNARHQIFTNLGAAGAATLGGIFENGDVTVLVQWLAANGTAKILTEPNVTVISGRQARFLAGGEFAVPTIVGIGGAQGQTTSFRGFGTSLLVTPTVTDSDMVRITALAEYSDLNQGNAVQGIPGTDSRRVETTVEMREGQTLALAGLLSHRTVTEVTRLPVLGDIPKVGPLLFSSKRSSQEENELLILITPEIVRPMDAHEVPPVPGFEVTVPQDVELYKYNMTEAAPDTGYYQLPPYGSGSVGTNVGYQHFNPGPANSMYSPQPTNPNGTGFTAPTPLAPGMTPPPNGNMPYGGPQGMPQGQPGYGAPPTYGTPPGYMAPQNMAPPASEMIPPGYGPNTYSPGLQPVPAGQSYQTQPPQSQSLQSRATGPGWSSPARATQSPQTSQTIQPVNYTTSGSPNSGAMPRGQRDAQPSARY